MLLLPSEEEGVVAALKPKNIPMKKLTINPEKVSVKKSSTGVVQRSKRLSAPTIA